MWVKQSTARTITFGPVMDTAGAPYTGALAYSDCRLSKNGVSAALNSSATATHLDNGHYSLALTAADLDTLGTAEIRLNKADYMAGVVQLVVLPPNTYDALVAGTDTLHADVSAMLGSPLKEKRLGNLADRASELVDIDGSLERRRIVLSACQETAETAQWTASGTGSIAWGTDDPFFGESYLTITTPSDGSAQQAIFTPTDTLAANGGLMFQLRTPSTFSDFTSLKLYIYPSAADDTNYYYTTINLGTNNYADSMLLDSQWRLCCSMGGYHELEQGAKWTPVRGSTLPVWGSDETPSLSIGKLVIEVTADSGKTPTLHVGQVATNYVQPVPILFCFDDGIQTVVTRGVPMFADAGLKGIIAANMGRCGEFDDWSNEYIATEEQLLTAQSAGWDIVSHGSPNHESMAWSAALSEAKVHRYLSENLDLMRQAGLHGTHYLVWPGSGGDTTSHYAGEIADQLGIRLQFANGATRRGHPGVSGTATDWFTCGLDATYTHVCARISPQNWSKNDIDEVKAGLGEGGAGESLRTVLDRAVNLGIPIMFHMYNPVDGTASAVGEISTTLIQQLLVWTNAKIAAGKAINCSLDEFHALITGGQRVVSELLPTDADVALAVDASQTGQDLADGGRLDLLMDTIAGDVAGLDGGSIPAIPTAADIADAVLDEEKGTHAGLLAGVALDATVAKPGDEMALTAAARIALVAAIESEIADDATGEAVKQAIVDKLVASLPDLDDLSVAAIAGECATATRDAILDRVLAGNHDTAGTVGKLLQNADVAVSSRSTFAGGPVASVTDRTGFTLTSAYDAAKTAAPTAQQNAAAVLDEPKGTHAGLLAGVALDETVAKPGNEMALTAAARATLVDALSALTPTERSAIADALLDRASGVETGVTVRQALQRIGAATAGKSEVTDAEVTFTGLNGVTTRISGTVDSLGNRTNIEYDPS